jgi:hypothetical protein
MVVESPAMSPPLRVVLNIRDERNHREVELDCRHRALVAPGVAVELGDYVLCPLCEESR